MLSSKFKKGWVSWSNFIFSPDYTYIKQTSREPKQNENIKNLAMDDLDFVYISL